MQDYSTKVGYVCNNIFRGLGNRLMILVGDMRVAKEYYKKPFYLRWNKLKVNFDELFDTNINMINYKPNKIDHYKYVYIYFDSHEEQLRGRVSSLPIFKNDKEYLKITDDYITMDYTRTPQYVIDIYLPFFKMLKPASNIVEQVDLYSKSFTENTISVHVRRGDFLNYAKRSKNTDDKYFNAMNSLIDHNKNVNITFFVSSDEPTTEQIFKDKYGDKVFIYPHTFDEKQEDEKTALICMLLLSKNNRMLLSKYSTFSYMAWWFGDCKASVTLI